MHKSPDDKELSNLQPDIARPRDDGPREDVPYTDAPDEDVYEPGEGVPPDGVAEEANPGRQVIGEMRERAEEPPG